MPCHHIVQAPNRKIVTLTRISGYILGQHGRLLSEYRGWMPGFVIQKQASATKGKHPALYLY